MIYIPKAVLKKLKLRKEKEIKKEEEELIVLRDNENTRKFLAAQKVIDKVGKEIGEMREWRPYCSDPKTYSPFPHQILHLTQQQMLELLMHAYGTADHLSRELKSLKKIIDE